MNVSQAISAHTGVDLRRGEVGMSEHFLHRAQIGATIQKMSCKRMSQRMRVRRRDRPAVDDSPHIARRKWPPCAVDEQRIAHLSIDGEQWPALVQPAIYCEPCGIGNRHEPLLGTFPPDRDRVGRGGEAGGREAAKFGDPHPAAVQQFDNSSVTELNLGGIGRNLGVYADETV